MSMARSDERVSAERDDYEEFLQYFSKSHRALFAYIMVFVHQQTDAEEIFQEASLILWKEFGTFRRDAPFLPWAKGVCFNQIRRYRRKRGREKLWFSGELMDELAREELAREDVLVQRKAALDVCLRKLPDRDRRILDLFYGARKSAQQIAEEIECSVHTVYKALQRVRRSLYECIDRRLATEES
ncbi:RNA polymerase sigma factor [Planctomycetes bacterium Pan216]|uniref:RNA polymerase sigma factor n=1 Tax=Kolteria novifilia TaxID=2527975 RepID=A0A518BBC1_9BACT|nr:RNA polymerase sigma factor [Planctomycetes bacterium Pan216]